MDDEPPFVGRLALVVGLLSVVSGAVLLAGTIAVLVWGRGRL